MATTQSAGWEVLREKQREDPRDSKVKLVGHYKSYRDAYAFVLGTLVAISESDYIGEDEITEMEKELKLLRKRSPEIVDGGVGGCYREWGFDCGRTGTFLHIIDVSSSTKRKVPLR